MAGICGYILKEKLLDKTASLSMISKLGLSNEFSSFYENDGKVFLAQKKQLNISKNGNFKKLDSPGLIILVEGYIFLENNVKKYLYEKYMLNPLLNDDSFLSYLYTEFGEELVHKISGWFNIVIYDILKSKCLILNDKLGYLPLFVFQNDQVLVFSSKIESILASRLIPHIEFDQVSIFEHHFFNYVISENTYIKGIQTLSPASILSVQNHTCNKETYWNISKFFQLNPLGKKQSLIILNNALQKSVDKVFGEGDEIINFSLTGGWDSRVLLSYLMKYKERLHLYSFGAPLSPDIHIPQRISKTFKIYYSPYILDQNYLQNDFVNFAQQTILESNGTRNYKRSHYLYAISKIAEFSTTAISGIYGDEVLKIAGPKGGNVISQNAIDFISSNYDLNMLKEKIENLSLLNGRSVLMDDFMSRMEEIKNQTLHFTLSQKYYHFRFIINLRKYFGAEVNSYNDYVNSFSPFIDTDFLKNYFESGYCGIFYPFNSKSIFLKIQTTKLYADLVKLNFPELSKFETDRGYSISDASNLYGNLKIGAKHFMQKAEVKNEFNTASTDEIFRKFMIDTSQNNVLINKPEDKNLNKVDMSLQFWMLQMIEKYNVT